jgi:DNA replication protein DnaC
MKTATCITCSQPFEYEPAILCGREYFPRTYCENCIAEHARTQARMERQQQADEVRHKWERICPPIYRDTDINRLTPEMRRYAETWTSENGRSLAFVGATGKCKTRVCYMILARYHYDGHGVFAITAAKLAEFVQKQFDNETRGESLEKLKLIERIPLLLLDDVGQEKITERTGSQFFSLIEQRTSWKRPTLWISNLDASTLKQALGAERGQPTIRRLASFSDIVKV